jgi:hypothetical protein
MATKVRLFAVLCAVVAAVVIAWQSAPAGVTAKSDVQLRSTAMPMDIPSSTIKWPIVATVDPPTPFAPCEDIPIDTLRTLGLAFTPPEPEDGLRCHFDAANYQMAIEPINWRTYEQSLSPDSIETTIGGHRAAWLWVMKPTNWNNRWWYSCMVMFKTSYGLIQQSLFFSPIYSDPDVDCPAENMMRANQLAPFYKF